MGPVKQGSCCFQQHRCMSVTSATTSPTACYYVLQVSKRAALNKKQVDDVLGGPDEWKNVQKTDGKAG